MHGPEGEVDAGVDGLGGSGHGVLVELLGLGSHEE